MCTFFCVYSVYFIINSFVACVCVCVSPQLITAPGNGWRPIRIRETSQPSNMRVSPKWRSLLSCCWQPIASWLQVGNRLMNSCTHRPTQSLIPTLLTVLNTASGAVSQVYIWTYVFVMQPQHDVSKRFILSSWHLMNKAAPYLQWRRWNAFVNLEELKMHAARVSLRLPQQEGFSASWMWYHP